MMSKRKVTFVIVTLVLSAILTAIALHDREKQNIARRQDTLRSAAVAERKSRTASQPTEPAAVVAPGQPAPVADPHFEKIVRDEAQRLDRVRVEPTEEQARVKKLVSALTPQQSRQLLHIARSPQSLAREKILSTYMLVEGGERSWGELGELISSPLVEKGPPEPHSESEMKGIREKSLRIMAIDGLFSRAQREPRAREILAKAIADIEDPYIKAYALRRLEQLGL